MSNVQQRLREINSALKTASDRYQDRHGGEMPKGACQHEAVDRRTPLDELYDKEKEVSIEGEEAVRIYMEAFAWILDYLFDEGPHPSRVMLRLYAWVKKYRPELIWDMGYRNLGVLLDESHAAMEWRIGILIDKYAEAKGLTGIKAPWQRTAEACDAYRRVQVGNSNRLGGKKSAKFKGKQQKTKKHT